MVPPLPPFSTKPYIVNPAPHAILPHLAIITNAAESAAESAKGHLDNQPRAKKALLLGGGGKKQQPQWATDIELLVSKMKELSVEEEKHRAIFYAGIEGQRVFAAGKNLRSALLLLGNALSLIYQDRSKHGEEARGVVETKAKLLQHEALELALMLSSHGDSLSEWNDVFGIIQRCRDGMENPGK